MLKWETNAVATASVRTMAMKANANLDVLTISFNESSYPPALTYLTDG